MHNGGILFKVDAWARRTVAAATLLLALPATAGTAAAAPAEPRSVPVTGPLVSLGETYCTDLVHVNLGLINDILENGVLNSAFGLITDGGLIILRPAELAQYGLVNADITYGDPPPAFPIENLPNNLVAVDLDPAWGLLLNGYPVQHCPDPTMSQQVEQDLNNVFEPGG